MAKKKDVTIYYCIGCNKIHGKSNFYTSFNSIHKNKVYPFCKDFIKDTVYFNETEIDVEKFKELLMMMDAPFIYNLWQSALTTGSEVIGRYFTNINLRQYRGMRWKNGDLKSETKDEDDFVVYNMDKLKVTPEMALRWGDKTSKKDIFYLEKFYRDMHTTHTIVTPQHEKALVLICKLQLKMDKCLEADDMIAFAKSHAEYQKLLQSSGLRPIDKIGGAEASGIRSFSQIFEEIEKDGYIKPAPIEENQDIIDKTIQYIMNYTLKLFNKQALTEPPKDTPKINEGEEDG